jgi:hypothetical protein
MSWILNPLPRIRCCAIVIFNEEQRKWILHLFVFLCKNQAKKLFIEARMSKIIKPNSIFCPSEDIVAREIEGELIIVPLFSGIGDSEDELFTLNETGRAIWKLMDGKRTIRQIIKLLIDEYKASDKEIEDDVFGLLEELLKRRIVVEK